MTADRYFKAAHRRWERAWKANDMAHRANDTLGGPFGCDGWNDAAWRFSRLESRHWTMRDRLLTHAARPSRLPCMCGGAS